MFPTKCPLIGPPLPPYIQELPNILAALQGGNVSLVTDQAPRVATVLDEMRQVYRILKDTEQVL